MNHQAAPDDDFLSRLTPDQRRRYERCRVRQQAFAAELFHADEPLRYKSYVGKESLEARLSLHAANLGDMLAAIAGRCPPDLAAELGTLRDWTAADSRRIVDDLFGRRRRDLAATTETPSPAAGPHLDTPIPPMEAHTAGNAGEVLPDVSAVATDGTTAASGRPAEPPPLVGPDQSAILTTEESPPADL